MAIRNENGYATLISCILVPLVFLSIGLIAFSLIKTQHRGSIQSACQVQYHNYFSQVRAQIYTIETLNPAAVLLYKTQLALTPFVWIPSVLKIYQSILKLRHRLDKLQRAMISSFNSLNAINVVNVFSNAQTTVQLQNTQTRKTLHHDSVLTFSVNPKLQIRKRMNIVFPPYDRRVDLFEKQKFSIFLKNRMTPESWIRLFGTTKLSENYTCQASLQSDADMKLLIKYKI